MKEPVLKSMCSGQLPRINKGVSYDLVVSLYLKFSHVMGTCQRADIFLRCKSERIPLGPLSDGGRWGVLSKGDAVGAVPGRKQEHSCQSYLGVI